MAVIVHFLNNLLVITLAKFGAVEALPTSPALLSCSAGYVLITAVLLSRPRIAEPSAIGEALISYSGPSAALHLRTKLIAAAAVLTFTTAFVWTAMAQG